MDQRIAAGITDSEDRRDNRRIRRWAVVIVVLLLAMGAVALGAWWMAIGIVVVSLCIAIWAFSA